MGVDVIATNEDIRYVLTESKDFFACVFVPVAIYETHADRAELGLMENEGDIRVKSSFCANKCTHVSVK